MLISHIYLPFLWTVFRHRPWFEKIVLLILDREHVQILIMLAYIFKQFVLLKDGIHIHALRIPFLHHSLQ